MSDQQQVTVTIGRGNPQDANYLKAARWADFKAVTRAQIEGLFGFQVVFAGDSTGEWEGSWEQNHAIIGIREPKDDLEVIEQVIRSLARVYNQDAIALCFGRSFLVTKG
jgi:hypothetical protein